VLRHYRGRWLRGDLLAGATVAAYLVPQVLAYAGIAGLPPVVGLWGSLPALAAYALLGTSRLLSAGPESTTALMTAAVVAATATGGVTGRAGLAAALAVAVGVLCLVARLLRLGVLADLLSRPTLVGYLAGLALIMMASQLGRLTGVAVHGTSFVTQVVSFVRGLPTLDAGTTVFAAAVLAFLLGVRRWLPQAPGPLLAVLLATAAVAVFGLDGHDIRVVGAIPAGIPLPVLPDLSLLPRLLFPAAGVLLVSYADTILTARSFPGPDTDGRIDANQELVALGVANLGAGLFRSLPVSSSGSRTALAATSGARTQLYSLVTLALVAATAEFLGPLLRLFPSPALGAIVVYAAVTLIDVRGFRRLARFRRSELLLALGALVGVLVLGILYGVLLVAQHETLAW
jgi:SulP family sulfate permease